jgi:hypothetical protein
VVDQTVEINQEDLVDRVVVLDVLDLQYNLLVQQLDHLVELLEMLHRQLGGEILEVQPLVDKDLGDREAAVVVLEMQEQMVLVQMALLLQEVLDYHTPHLAHY